MLITVYTCHFNTCIFVLHYLLYLPIEDESLSEDELRLYRDVLQQFYRDVFSEIKTSPLDPTSCRDLEDIYVRLLLKDSNVKESIAYDNLVEFLAGHTQRARVAFIGQAGVGKTTLLAKIAYDWAIGKHLTKISLLFFVPLRDTHKIPRFADILLKYLPRVRNIDTRKVDKYIREHQRKVMLLLDGLDEYSGDITQEDPSDALIGIMRGDELTHAPVIVTTRPWRAEEITSVGEINKQYTRVFVEGFRKEDVKIYINKYFKDNLQTAKSLIHLMTEDSLISENMAPYPIFCCMLCHIWKEESRRNVILKLHTFTQLFDEMFDSLTTQWYSKNISMNTQRKHDDCLKELGRVAFEGLLTRQLVFNKKDIQESSEIIQVGCEIGVLSSEKTFADNLQHARQNITNVSFPHKLFQEYIAGLYLASMYSEDPARFAKLLKETIIPQYKEFRYLLYFTAAHGNRLGNAGKALMESLCTEVKDDSFIVDVAFECHDELSIAPVTQIFRKKRDVKLLGIHLESYIDIGSEHTRSGCMYMWSVCCKILVSR